MSKTSTKVPLTDKDRRKQISIRGLPFAGERRVGEENFQSSFAFHHCQRSQCRHQSRLFSLHGFHRSRSSRRPMDSNTTTLLRYGSQTGLLFIVGILHGTILIEYDDQSGHWIGIGWSSLRGREKEIHSCSGDRCSWIFCLAWSVDRRTRRIRRGRGSRQRWSGPTRSMLSGFDGNTRNRWLWLWTAVGVHHPYKSLIDVYRLLLDTSSESSNRRSKMDFNVRSPMIGKRHPTREREDRWSTFRLRYGNPWEIPRPEYQIPVNLYGRVIEQNGKPKWVDTKVTTPFSLEQLMHTSLLGNHGDALRYARAWF